MKDLAVETRASEAPRALEDRTTSVLAQPLKAAPRIRVMDIIRLCRPKRALGHTDLRKRSGTAPFRPSEAPAAQETRPAKPSQIWSTLAGCRLLSRCSSAILERLADRAQLVTFGAGDFVALAGDPVEGLHVIARGEARVGRPAAETPDRKPEVLSAGDHFGEIAPGVHRRHSVTVVAAGPLEVVQIPAAALREVMGCEPEPDAATGVGAMTDICRRFMDHKLSDASLRTVMGQFILWVVGWLCGLAWLLTAAPQLVESVGGSQVLSTVLILGTAVASAVFARRTRYGLSFFGVTSRGLRRSLTEGLLWTIPVVTALTLTRALLVRYVPSYAGQPVLGSPASGSPLLILGYLALIPLQEFVFRGGIQGACQRFFTGRHRTLFSVLVSSAIFATVHLYISIPLAVASFFAGLLWGWMFARHASLAGATLSHVILGAWIFYVVDLGLGPAA